MTLTDDEIRIKVAEAMGWEVISDTLCNVKPDKNGDPEIEPIAPLPNYPESLDACAEFEKTLTDEEWDKYSDNILLLSLGPVRMVSQLNKAKIGAGPKTKCIAYLKTKGILP